MTAIKRFKCYICKRTIEMGWGDAEWMRVLEHVMDNPNEHIQTVEFALIPIAHSLIHDEEEV